MTIEELQILVTANTTELQKEMSSMRKDLTHLQKQASTSTNLISKSFKSLKTGIVSLGIGALITKGISSVTSHLDDAILRLDTLNNYDDVISNLGIGGDLADQSIQKLSDELTGLPTTLNQAALAVQRFTSANSDIKASTEMFLAFNNAVLAGGASADIRATALEQFSQAYAKGKMDVIEWRSLMTAMPAQLKQVAIAMGYASTEQLGESLRNGTVSMNEFMVTLIKLNKQGLNGFASFETQARNATGGVGTSIINVKTAITRGLTDIMNAIGQSNIAGFFQGVAKAINNCTPYITGFIKAVVTAVSTVSSLFGGGKNKETKDATASIENLGASGTSTAANLDSTASSAKNLKKELKGLAGFDEMNVLSESSGSSADTDDSSSSSALGTLDLDLSGWDTSLKSTSSKVDEIANSFTRKFEKIGNMLSSIWNSEPIQAFVSTASTLGSQFVEAWTTIGSTLSFNMQQTWSSIQENVSNALTNTSTLWTTFWRDIEKGIKNWGAPIIDGVAGIFSSIWEDIIDPTLDFISTAWEDFSGTLVDLWEQHGAPLVNEIGEFVDKTISLFQTVWDSVIEPIVSPFLSELKSLWDNHLGDMVKNLGSFVASVVTAALQIYNNFIQPIVSWLLEKLAPVWASATTKIIGAVGTIIGVIADLISGITTTLTGIINFISGVFTGNWSKAWYGIKSIFSGVVQSFAGIFKGIFNLIIDAFNGFIAGVNKFKISVPNWVPVIGGKSWQPYPIAKIPKLATGGVVNKATPAIIGEAGKEVVMPLERNTGWITELADKLNERAGATSVPFTFIFKLGEETIAEKVFNNLRDKDFETNGDVYAYGF